MEVNKLLREQHREQQKMTHNGCPVLVKTRTISKALKPCAVKTCKKNSTQVCYSENIKGEAQKEFCCGKHFCDECCPMQKRDFKWNATGNAVESRIYYVRTCATCEDKY